MILAGKISKWAVSIPERVWGGLELSLVPINHLFIPVSIPERVWGGLEQRMGGLGPRCCPFQSLRGFGVGWSASPAEEPLRKVEFQSLRGFGVGWSDSAVVVGYRKQSFNP